MTKKTTNIMTKNDNLGSGLRGGSRKGPGTPFPEALSFFVIFCCHFLVVFLSFVVSFSCRFFVICFVIFLSFFLSFVLSFSCRFVVICFVIFLSFCCHSRNHFSGVRGVVFLSSWESCRIWCHFLSFL